ncbi:hypothetical protein [Candidatus Uabimicrobium amorphum]|uniref:Uncharacterized protein n=1 Tax=Uabimicrobium amorphum TaxID=2596890 RepID=A0A5S9F5W0_UABAM|nr:hypothetical protein [Candidatus Uabimicrobium amorphum]BBM86731.1 hypothetical protein UABAM_05118 [Candidatus Uabimicrobium amorphum]
MKKNNMSFIKNTPQKSDTYRQLQEYQLYVDYLVTTLRTLDKAVDYIVSKLGITLELDRYAQQYLQQDLSHLSSLGFETISIEEFLYLALSPQQVKWNINEGVLRIRAAQHKCNKLYLKTYDISDLVFSSSVLDKYDAVDKPYKIFGENFEQEEIKDNYYTPGEIVAIVKEKVLQKYEYNSTMITTMKDKLFIRHYSHVHNHIESFLENLRISLRHRLHIGYGFIAFRSNFFKESNLDFTPIHTIQEKSNNLCLYATVNNSELSCFLQSVTESKSSQVIHKEDLELHQLESRNITNVTKTDFLAGTNNDGDIVGRMFEGVSLKIQPEIREQKCKIDYNLTVKVASIAKPIPTFPIANGEIAVPNQKLQTIETKISVPYNHTVFLAGFHNPYDLQNDKSFSAHRKKENLMIYINANVESFY